MKSEHELKKELRLFFIDKRKHLSKERREEAKLRVMDELLPLLSTYPLVLSFASTKEEIDLTSLNQALAEERRLALPRVEKKELAIYLVTDMKTQLEKSKWKILEPKPTLCKSVFYEKIACILVPAIGFDVNRHRLGVGGGYYDRLLKQTPHCPHFGVGFQEQLVHDFLPTLAHDVSLTHLYLF